MQPIEIAESLRVQHFSLYSRMVGAVAVGTVVQQQHVTVVQVGGMVLMRTVGHSRAPCLLVTLTKATAIMTGEWASGWVAGS